MRFRLLGNLEVWNADRRLAPGGQRAQRVLAVLLLEPNRAVPLARLVEAAWDEQPPMTAEKQVRNTVSQLRTLLSAGTGASIHAEGTGYRIAVDEDELDSRRFEAAVAAAGRAAAGGDPQRARAVLASGLELWRGPALAGLSGRVIEAAAALWDERRSAARELYFEYELASGDHRRAVAGLMAFVAEHPLREKPVGQLMLALHRCGRSGEALGAYREFRARLAAELGLDPGAELERLQRRILAADPALAPPRPPAPPLLGPVAVPRQLPTSNRHFAGRADHLKALDALPDQVDEPGAAAALATITGTAGVGKSTLAVHWAHRAADRFPDGQLYVNLRGFDPAEPPAAPADVIRGFLDSFGVPPGQVPAGRDAQAALYRSLLADRRVLLVLDNARDTEQVRPLLPGGARCAAVVTSRDGLAGLVAAEGATPVRLDLLSAEEARDLLARRLGPERVAADVPAAGRLIAACANLPLALSIAAARLTMLPSRSLDELARHVQDDRARLDALDVGDLAVDARAVFSWSYRELTAPAARLFRLLGIHPGPDITVAAAASLAAVTRTEAQRLLHELTRTGLITEQTPGRYSFHDLLRAYATEKARAHESEDESCEAERRALDHYLRSAQRASLRLSPAAVSAGAVEPVHGVIPERPAGYDDAMAWLTAELPVLVASVARAAADSAADDNADDSHGSTGLESYAWRIPAALVVFLDRRGHWQELADLQGIALATALRTADRRGEAAARRGLGRAGLRLRRYPEALDHLERALAIDRCLGDALGEADACHDLALVYEQLADNRKGLELSERVLELQRTARRHRGALASAVNNVGWFRAALGDYEGALTACQEALQLFHGLGDTAGEAGTLDSIGYAQHHLGRYAQAVDSYSRSAELYRRVGDRYYEAGTLVRLGDTNHAAGHRAAAQKAWQQALSILEMLNHPDADTVRATLASAA